MYSFSSAVFAGAVTVVVLVSDPHPAVRGASKARRQRLSIELVQMREIPAREGRVDGLRELLEAVRGADDKHTVAGILKVNPAAAEQVDSDLKPSSRHRLRRLTALRRVLRHVLREVASRDLVRPVWGYDVYSNSAASP